MRYHKIYSYIRPNFQFKSAAFKKNSFNLLLFNNSKTAKDLYSNRKSFKISVGVFAWKLCFLVILPIQFDSCERINQILYR